MGSCNSVLNKPCLSETDNRYDANFPKDIAEQVSLHIRPVVTIGYTSDSFSAFILYGSFRSILYPRRTPAGKS